MSESKPESKPEVNDNLLLTELINSSFEASKKIGRLMEVANMPASNAMILGMIFTGIRMAREVMDMPPTVVVSVVNIFNNIITSSLEARIAEEAISEDTKHIPTTESVN